MAEKIVTAVQRGTASTRWRDFGDIWTLSHNHTLRGADIQEAIEQVAAHREADLSALETALVGYADLAQARWVQWKRKLKLGQLPDDFAEVLAACIEFSDPALRGDVTGKTWDPSIRTWS